MIGIYLYIYILLFEEILISNYFSKKMLNCSFLARIPFIRFMQIWNLLSNIFNLIAFTFNILYNQLRNKK